MLLSAPYSADRFRDPVVSGLRSLLVAPDAGRGTTVVTRAAAAAASRGYIAARSSCDGGGGGGGGEDAGASGDGSSIGRSEDTNNSKEDVEAKADEKEAGGTAAAEEEEELDGFWVSYGRRCPRRRLLPPPIPSLVARGALRRTRTGDGRLVIRVVPVVRPECVRARRRGDRLTMQLVEHEEDSPMMLPPLREVSSCSAREDPDIVAQAAAGEDDTATPEPATEAVVAAPGPETKMAQAVPPPRVSSVGCFEDVFKFDPIGSSSLHQMPSLRMVH